MTPKRSEAARSRGPLSADSAAGIPAGTAASKVAGVRQIAGRKEVFIFVLLQTWMISMTISDLFHAVNIVI
jgi:hypothetical protein